MAVTTRSRFFGRIFPDVNDVAGRVFWGPLFPDPAPISTGVTPTEPQGVATFALTLEDGLTVTFEWQTDIFKARDGTEQRRAILDSPRRRFQGSALLIGSREVLMQRGQLARFAASGSTFAIGLPYESLYLASDSVGVILTVYPGALANCDWANPGQRVTVIGRDLTTVNAVIQNASATEIYLDVDPGSAGLEGGYVAPLISVHLDAQQPFDRYRTPTGFERWNLKASAASFGFLKSAVAATLDIEAVYSAEAPNLVPMVIQARETGVAGNLIRVSIQDDSLSGVDLEEVGNDVTIRFVPGVTTVGELAAAINSLSTLVRAVNGWNEAFICGDGADDTFALTFLTGGADGDTAEDGQGATVAMHISRPVFDRPLLNQETNEDALLAMTELVDLGGVSTAVGPAVVPDWARAIVLDQPLEAEWQWFKRFLSTLLGGCVEFWLPSWRSDLVVESFAGDTLTVTDYDFAAWYPRRRNVQVLQVDGTLTYATIVDVVDNGDGTLDLQLSETFSAAPIDLVSWLELCRFEQDSISVQFKAANFSVATVARAVTQ